MCGECVCVDACVCVCVMCVSVRVCTCVCVCVCVDAYMCFRDAADNLQEAGVALGSGGVTESGGGAGHTSDYCTPSAHSPLEVLLQPWGI